VFIRVGEIAIALSAITEVYDSLKKEKYRQNKVAVTVLGRPFGEDYEFEDAQADEFRRQFEACLAAQTPVSRYKVGDHVMREDGTIDAIREVRGEFVQCRTEEGYVTEWMLAADLAATTASVPASLLPFKVGDKLTGPRGCICRILSIEGGEATLERVLDKGVIKRSLAELRHWIAGDTQPTPAEPEAQAEPEPAPFKVGDKVVDSGGDEGEIARIEGEIATVDFGGLLGWVTRSLSQLRHDDD